MKFLTDIQFKPTPLDKAVPGTMYTAFGHNPDLFTMHIIHTEPRLDSVVAPDMLRTRDWFMYLGHVQRMGHNNKSLGWFIHVLTPNGPGYIWQSKSNANEFLHGMATQ